MPAGEEAHQGQPDLAFLAQNDAPGLLDGFVYRRNRHGDASGDLRRMVQSGDNENIGSILLYFRRDDHVIDRWGPGTPMTTAFITHRDCLLHDMGAHHPECPERLSAISDRLIAAGLDLYLSFYDAPWRLSSRLPASILRIMCAA
ncbi:hypothetical protein MASR1M97_03000 [Candidatus Desulfobacillus denitrificans]